jgi:hypothetical protein
VAVIEVLAQIAAKTPKFNAGIVLWNDVVVEAAPIVGYMKKQRWTRDRVRDYCRERGWKVTVVWEIERHDVSHGR